MRPLSSTARTARTTESTAAAEPATGRSAAVARPVCAGPGGAGVDGGARRRLARSAAGLLLVSAAALLSLGAPGVALHGTGEAAAPGTGGIALLRAVVFAALGVQLGELLTRRLLRGLPGGPQVGDWSAPAAWAGFAAAVGLASVVSTGNLLPRRLGDLDLVGLTAHRDGALALVEVNALVAAALCARHRLPAVRLLPPAAVIGAEALRAHPPAEHAALTGAVLTAVHLTCAALWAGGLARVLRLLGAWRAAAPGAAAALLGRYARTAAWLLAGVTVTGLCGSLRRMPQDTVLDQLTGTAYGRVVLAKVLLVGAAAGLALAARTRLRRAADPLTAWVPARAELVLLAAVVALSGLLSALPVPIRW